MSRILAIEPDPERGRALLQFVRDRVGGDVVLATSTDAAIAAMSEQDVDLILASVLLPPKDDSQLTAFLKGRDSARNLSVLVVPPVIEAQAPAKNRWPLSGLRRRAEPWPAYDADAVTGRIQDALTSQSRSKEQSELSEARETDMMHALSETETSTALCVRNRDQVRTERFRARRWNGTALSWLSGVTLPSGLEVQLLNISASGLLVESGLKFAPGQSVAFQLWGPTGNSRHRHHHKPPKPQLTVPARIVRSEVGTMNGRGVKYRTAVVFENPVHLSL